MAKLPEFLKNGFVKIKYMSKDNIKFVDNNGGQPIVVDPNIAKESIKTILLNEIGCYVEGCFQCTSDNISKMIEKNKTELLAYTNSKIDQVAQELAEELVSRMLKEKFSDSFIDSLIEKLTQLKNK